MSDKVEYHKAWRAQKKQNIAEALSRVAILEEYCDTLLDTTSKVNEQLKKVAPLLELNESQLRDVLHYAAERYNND
jgi:hypothetical protein